MTSIRFFRTGSKIHGFIVKGHSGYASSGQDIVCAAVSAVTQTAVIGLLEVVEINILLDVKDKDGYLKCMLPQGFELDPKWNDSQIVLYTLFKGLKAICAEYGDFLKIEEV